MGEASKPQPDLTQGFTLPDIAEGGMLAGCVGDEAVLLFKQGGVISAVSGSCTHLGAPLSEGLVRDGKVRCPWHHACFDLKTGAAIEAPAFDPLERFAVRMSDDRVILEKKAEAASSRPARSTADARSFVIVGGGAAGFAAADQLRKRGFTGQISMISAELDAPYDRTLLTKDYLDGSFGDDRLPIARESLAALDVHFLCEKRATKLDPAGHVLTLSDGTHLPYTKLLLATGATPILPDFPGNDLPHVQCLRSLKDCRSLLAKAKPGCKLVLLGGSFIALEAAAALRDRGLDITIVAKEDQPLANIFGPQLSKAICAVHEAHGNRFILGRTITATSEGEVMLDDGSRLACDVLLVGTGVKPAIELAVVAGFTADQGVVVDPYLATSAPDVFAAGDIAAWPDPHSDQRIRVEHWTVAERQGQVAARNMLGERQAFRDVPFFWTKHFDFAVRYLGHAAHWDEISLDGDLGTRDCTIHYLEKGRRAAAAFVGRDAACLAWREAMERNRAA